MYACVPYRIIAANKLHFCELIAANKLHFCELGREKMSIQRCTFEKQLCQYPFVASLTVLSNKSQLYLSEKVYFIAFYSKRKRVIRHLVGFTATPLLGL